MALLLSLTSKSPAQVVFTLTGTANDNNLGYVMGQTYTFVLTTGASFANTSTSTFLSYRNLWSEQTTTDNQLWANIGGSGLSSGYSRPTSAADAPASSLRAEGPPSSLYFYAGTDEFLGTIGLTTPASNVIGGFEFSIEADTTTFSFVGAFTEMNSFFPAYNGTYVPTTPGTGRVFLPNVFSGSQAEFTITSLTINGGTAVPEPSSYATLFGIIVMAFVIRQRRRAG